MNYALMLASRYRDYLQVRMCAAVAIVLAVATLLVLTGSSETRAADPALSPDSTLPPVKCVTEFRVREQDAIWLIGTRHLDCNVSNFSPSVHRFEKGLWVASTLEEFYATDTEVVIDPISEKKVGRYTTFWVHGNRIDANQAASDGLTFYFELAGRTETTPPIRHVIWTWPSTQIKGPIRDVRSKAARSDVEAAYLGMFMGGMNPGVQLRVIGYSYGGRIVTGAMHMLGNGTWMGLTLPEGKRPNARVALWVPGEHCHWLLPGHAHGNAIPAADAWLSLYNRCDEVLWRYPKLDPCDESQALGFAGLCNAASLPADYSERWNEWSVNHLIGAEHNMRLYWGSHEVISRTRSHLFAPLEKQALASQTKAKTNVKTVSAAKLSTTQALAP